MTKKDIDRILKQGSVRQKIKLYMTDTALTNISSNHLEIDPNNKDIIGTKLLTNKQREILWDSIKEPKDVKYYEDLRIWNKSFILFKDKFTIDLVKLQATYYLISISYGEQFERDKSIDLVNDLLELYPDEKNREKAFKLALNKIKGDGGIVCQEENHPKYLDLDKTIYWEEIKLNTKQAIKLAESCKEYISMFKVLINKNLPLKPYKDWIIKEEKFLKNLIKAIYTITVEDNPPTDFPKIKLYEKINTDITEEDLKDVKNAGI